MSHSKHHDPRRPGGPDLPNQDTAHPPPSPQGEAEQPPYERSEAQVPRLHGDLARAIAARHLRERAESMERRRELLRTEVFAIVKNMLARGERPIRARVQKMLSADSLKAWKTLGRFLNEATGNFMNSQTEHPR